MSTLSDMVSNVLNRIGLSEETKQQIRSFVVDNSEKYGIKEGYEYELTREGDYNTMIIYSDEFPEEALMEMYQIVCPD